MQDRGALAISIIGEIILTAIIVCIVGFFHEKFSAKKGIQLWHGSFPNCNIIIAILCGNTWIYNSIILSQYQRLITIFYMNLNCLNGFTFGPPCSVPKHRVGSASWRPHQGPVRTRFTCLPGTLERFIHNRSFNLHLNIILKVRFPGLVLKYDSRRNAS